MSRAGIPVMIVVDGNASLGSNDQIVDHLVKDRQAYPNWESHDSSRHCLHFYAREHMAWGKCRSRRPSRIRLQYEVQLRDIPYFGILGKVSLNFLERKFGIF